MHYHNAILYNEPPLTTCLVVKLGLAILLQDFSAQVICLLCGEAVIHFYISKNVLVIFTSIIWQETILVNGPEH